jgi:hypothetical protein
MTVYKFYPESLKKEVVREIKSVYIKIRSDENMIKDGLVFTDGLVNLMKTYQIIEG